MHKKHVLATSALGTLLLGRSVADETQTRPLTSQGYSISIPQAPNEGVRPFLDYNTNRDSKSQNLLNE